MPLTPENIQNQQFHVRFRGFDVDEVDAFLEKVAENYLVLVKTNEKLTDEMAAIQGERDQIQSQERTFKNAIIAAQTIADEMQAKAKQEAHVLKENARLDAAAMIDAAKEQEASLKKQIASLLLEKQKLKDDLQAFLMSHMDRLDSQYPAISQEGGTAKNAVAKEAPQPSVVAASGAPSQADFQSQGFAMVEEPQPEAPEALPTEMAEDDDLAALYEKIDLAEFGHNGLPEVAASPLAAEAPEPKNAPLDYATDELDDLELTMPDLDGDMLFTLDDPLDDPLGPEVTIEPMELDNDFSQK